MNYHSPHYSCDVIKTLSTPEIVRVSQDLFAAKFDLMKFTPAKLILETALSSGALNRTSQGLEILLGGLLGQRGGHAFGGVQPGQFQTLCAGGWKILGQTSTPFRHRKTARVEFNKLD